MVVVLKCYFDGATDNHRMMTLSCVAATEEVWSELESAWEQVRKDRGNPEYIHMTDLMALEGIYEAWSAEQKDYLIEGLLSVLNSFMDHPKLQSFTSRVDLEAHQEISATKRLPRPERICTRLLFPHIVHWFYRSEESVFVEMMDLFFDRGERFMHHIRADWENKKVRRSETLLELIRVIEEVDMKLTPPVQIADMVCWGLHRQATYNSASPWVNNYDEYTTAVRCANAIRGTFIPVDVFVLRHAPFREEGQALIEMWNKRARRLVTNPSKEFVNFDRMMRKLMHTSHADLETKLELERAAKKRNKSKKSCE